MLLQDSQFTVIHNQLKTTPLLPWSIVGKLLWDLDTEIFNDIEKVAKRKGWHFKYFIDGFSHFKGYSIVLVDHQLKICAASSNIKKMTGYEAKEMIGMTPRILQGDHTDQHVRDLMRHAIEAEVPFHSRVLNYRKDGTPYGCEIHAFPIYDDQDQLAHYIGFEKEYMV
ncbi:PAS domain-containing protein [Nonlabens xiamenensis]|uniref:PAS domain-containing protein n=1 Tax=Nonlabens xiamenensis TaxID=2341043 RepID=UPI000F60C789|nr:PAS domain-containing protein [Nonlabens xiamenensis]